MKIAVLGIRGLPANYSGFETCADHTTRHWVVSGHSVLVYCRKNRYRDRIKSYQGAHLRYLPQLTFKGVETLSHTFLSILDVCLFYRSYPYIHLYNVGNAIFLPILKLFRKKVVISVDGIEWKRDKWNEFAKRMYKLGEQFAVQFADEIIVDNPEIEEYYQKKFGKKTTYIAYGAKILNSTPESETSFLAKYGLEPGKYFIFVGRLVPEKGTHHLIDAYKNLNTSYPLVVIGDDHSNSEYKMKLMNENSNSIRMLGFKFGDEYEELLSNALLYISASSLEGTSPSLLAAMGAGVCALVNGIPENKYTVEDCAYTFEENNFQDLEAQWRYLISNPDKILEMSILGKNHVIQEYSWSKIAESYLNTFKRL